MSILVTGGAGFIASHVVDMLVARGETVIILDSLEPCASPQNLNDTAVFEKADICDEAAVTDILLRHRVKRIMHFAAESHVDRSFANAYQFTRTNVLGTQVLLECAKVHGVDLFMHVSTDEVYGENTTDTPSHVGSTLRPTNPYAASKAAAEGYVTSYALSFSLPVMITRCNNVYGPRQYPEKLVPKLLIRARRGMPLQVHGHGEQRRSFLYVTDAAHAFVCLLDKGEPGATYNIGADDEVTVLQVVERVKAMHPSVVVQHVRDREFNDQRYFVCDKQLRDLGWQPRVGFKEGLAQTRTWYDANDLTRWGPDAVQCLEAHPPMPATARADARPGTPANE